MEYILCNCLSFAWGAFGDVLKHAKVFKKTCTVHTVSLNFGLAYSIVERGPFGNVLNLDA